MTEAQLAANRANSQKSTGPVTPEGKAKSCLNAVKTGLTGQTVLLPTDDVAAYQAHLDRHFLKHSPTNDEERTLVQFLADTEWRLLRIAPLEAGIYALGRLKLAGLHPEEKDPATRDALIRSEIFIAYRRELNNIALQERRLRNQYNADLEKLETLRKERPEKEKAEAIQIRQDMSSALKILNRAKQNNLAFDPAEFGFEFSVEEIERYQALQERNFQFTGTQFLADKVVIAFRRAGKGAQAA